MKNFPACVVPPIPDKHRLGRLLSHRKETIAKSYEQNTSRATGSHPSLSNVAEWSRSKL